MFPDLDEPLRTGQHAPHDAAVVIGVEDYAFVPDVPYAHRDAHLVRDLLVYTRGVPEEQVTLLTDPSREQVQRALSAAAGRVQAGGTLWVYFAGHGAATVDDGARIVLGVDVMADPAVFEERGIRVADLAPSVPGASTLLILDTCYAGVGRGGAELVAGTRFAVPTWAVAPPTGGAVWTASGPNQLASPAAGVEHGAFTWLVAGALRGWADGELDGRADGSVTLEEGHAWVARQLRGSPLRQQPELVVDGGGSRVLSTGVGEAAPTLPPSLWHAAPPGSTTAPAAEGPSTCPWPRGAAVEVTRATVTVGGRDHLVQGKPNRTSFAEVLEGCGYTDAAEYFRQWRAAGRTRNALVYPLVITSLPSALISGTRRKAFEAAMEDGR